MKGHQVNQRMFQSVAQLGKGAFGTVYKVLSKLDSKFYVIKRIDVKHFKHKKANPMREVEVMKQLDHPNVVKYIASFLEKDQLCIVMEYVQRGDLYKMIKQHRQKRSSFNENQVVRLGLDISRGLEYLHSKGIIHRDIKAMNILIDKDGRAKIADLGVSKFIGDELHHTRVGTPLYLAPEIIKNQHYDAKVDIWALGCIIYQALTLQMPFLAKNLIQLGYEIVNKPVKSIGQSSEKLNSLIRRLLSKESKSRPSAKQVKEQLAEQVQLKIEIRPKSQIRLESKLQIKRIQLLQVQTSQPKNSRPVLPPSLNLVQVKAFDKRTTHPTQIISLKSIEIKDSAFDDFKLPQKQDLPFQKFNLIRPQKRAIETIPTRLRPLSAFPGNSNSTSLVTLSDLMKVKNEIRQSTKVLQNCIESQGPQILPVCQKHREYRPKVRALRTYHKPSIVSFSYKSLK